MHVEAEIVIDRPIAEVWRFCAEEHVRNHPRWDPSIHLWQDVVEPLGVGSIIRRRNTRSGSSVEGTMEVVAFEPQALFRVRIREGVETIGSLRFEAVDARRTRRTKGADMPGFGAEHDASALEAAMDASLVSTKALIESGA